jgi:putative FmdB family regulatory protein
LTSTSFTCTADAGKVRRRQAAPSCALAGTRRAWAAGMPDYEFRCRACGETFERTMHIDQYDRMRGSRGTECPKCKSKEVVPQISTFQVQTSNKTI